MLTRATIMFGEEDLAIADGGGRAKRKGRYTYFSWFLVGGNIVSSFKYRDAAFCCCELSHKSTRVAVVVSEHIPSLIAHLVGDNSSSFVEFCS